MPQLGQVLADLEAGAPDRFAGGWIDHEPHFGAVVRLTGTAPLQAAIAAAMASPELVVELGAPHTMVEILAGKDKITPVVHLEHPTFGIGFDRRQGAIRLDGPDALTSQELALLTKLAGVPVTARVRPASRPLIVYGGKYMDDSAGACTSGFSVIDAVSQLSGIMTAGHCFADDANYWQYYPPPSGGPWPISAESDLIQTRTSRGTRPVIPRFRSTGTGPCTEP